MRGIRKLLIIKVFQECVLYNCGTKKSVHINIDYHQDFIILRLFKVDE